MAGRAGGGGEAAGQAFPRSVLTSLLATGLDFVTLAALVELGRVDYVLAAWLGSLVGAVTNFTVSRSWVFRVPDRAAHRLLRFVLVQAGSSGLHTLGVWLLTSKAALPYLGSKVVTAVAVYLAWNYPLARAYVFGAANRGAATSAARWERSD